MSAYPPFHGWAAAVTHRYGRFSCWACLREEGKERARRLLRERTTGLCEVCRQPEAAPCGWQFLCGRCGKAIDREHPDRKPEDLLRELSRRRNLERRSSEALATLDLNSEIATLSEGWLAAQETARTERFSRLAKERLADRHEVVKRKST